MPFWSSNWGLRGDPLELTEIRIPPINSTFFKGDCWISAGREKYCLALNPRKISSSWIRWPQYALFISSTTDTGLTWAHWEFLDNTPITTIFIITFFFFFQLRKSWLELTLLYGNVLISVNPVRIFSCRWNFWSKWSHWPPQKLQDLYSPRQGFNSQFLSTGISFYSLDIAF